MTGHTRRLLVIAALLCPATTVSAGDAEPGSDDLPSIELLEYLAEFEALADGRLLDPLDLQRDTGDELVTADEPRRPTR